MKKWLSLLLTLMLLVNSVITPVAAMAEAATDNDVVTEAPTAFPVGYAYAEDNIYVFNYLDTDGDGVTERVQIGKILAGGTVYVAEGYSDGVWAYIAFAAPTSKGTRVVEGYARVDGLTHVSPIEGGGYSYRDHPLEVVDYNEVIYDIPKANEEPAAEEPETEEPETEESEVPEVTEPETEESEIVEPETEEPEVPEVEEPETEEPEVPEIDTLLPGLDIPVIAVPEIPETEEPETEEPEVPEIDDLLPGLDIPVMEVPEVEEPETEETETPEIDDMLPELDVPVMEVPEVEEPETEEPEVEESEVPEVEEPEVEETEEPEVEEPEVEEPETEETEEPEVEEAEEPITSLSTLFDSSVITLTAEPGVLPAGAELMVEPVDLGAAERVIMANLPSGSVLVSFNAYDITLLVNDEVVQPAGNVNVQITNAVAPVTLSAATKTTQTIIYHLDGNTATEVTAPQPVAPTVNFVVPHFSVYVVAVVDGKKEAEGAYQSKNGNGSITVEVVDGYDENGNAITHEENVDLDSAAFDFHIFTEDATLNAHTNGNIAADNLDAGGNAFGNNQFNDSKYESENYFGISVKNLASINGGRVIIGKDIYFLVSTADNNVYIGKAAVEKNADGEVGYYVNGQWVALDSDEYDKAEAAGEAILEGKANNAFQEQDGKYLDITAELNKLAEKSGTLANARETENVKVKHTSNDGWTLDTTKTTQKTVIVNIDAGDEEYRNGFNVNINVDPGQTVIINVDVTNNHNLGNWSATLNGLVNAEDAVFFDCNVIWNFYEVVEGVKVPYSGQGDNTLVVGNGRGFFGVVMAPDAEVQYGAVDGTVIGRKTRQNGNESHQMNFHTGDTASVTVIKKLFSADPKTEITHKDENGKEETIVVEGGTFYFALFVENPEGSDKWERDLTIPVKAIRLGNWEEKSVSFYGLERGKKYKVFETNAKGEPVVVNGKFNSYDVEGDGAIVEAGVTGKDTATITNDDHTGGDEPKEEPDRSEAEYAPKGTKVITGDPDETPKFKFVIEFTGTDKGGKVNDLVTMPANRTVTIDAAGNFSFDPIKFECYYDGTYDAYFKIYEVPVGEIPDGWTYDAYEANDWGGTRYWKLTVKVLEGNKADGKTKEITDLQIDYQWQGESHSNHQHQQNSEIATFYNDYKLPGFAPKVEKQYDLENGKQPAEDPIFTFKMKLLDPDGQQQQRIKWPNDVIPEDLTFVATVTGEGKVSFPRIEFRNDGTYKFEIWEVPGDDADWDYDPVIWTLVVTVNQAGQAQESITSYFEGREEKTAVFTNTYNGDEDEGPTGTAQVKVTKTVAVLNGTTADIPENTDFTFTLSNNDTVMQIKTLTWPTDFENGAVSKELLFDKLTDLPAGTTLTLTLKETATNPATNWSARDTEWIVTIVVPAEGGEATVTYKKNADSAAQDEATITNTYTVEQGPEPGTAQVKVTKTVAVLNGTTADIPENTDFTFTLSNNDTVMQTKTLTWPTDFENGAVSKELLFDKLTDLPAGTTLTLTLKETATSPATNWSARDTEWIVTIVVPAEGGEATVTYKKADADENAAGETSATIVNTYEEPVKQPTELQFKVKKDYTGDIGTNTQIHFTFTATGSQDAAGTNRNLDLNKQHFTVDGKLAATTTQNLGDKITFNDVGTYVFTIVETGTDGNGWTLDKTVWVVTVVISDDDHDGVLEKTITYYTVKNGEQSETKTWTDGTVFTAEFVNAYSAGSIEVPLGFNKTVNPGTQPSIPTGVDQTFTFTLTPDASNPSGYELTDDLELTKTIVGATAADVVFGNIKFTKEGTYRFTVTESAASAVWTANVLKWIIEVKVTDNNGSFSTQITSYSVTMENGAEKTESNGSYQYVPFVNTYNQDSEDTTFTPAVKKVANFSAQDGENPSVKSFDFTLAIKAGENYGNDVVMGATTTTVDTTVTDTATFGTITFKAENTYYFTITETAKTGDGWTYSTDVWELEVKVERNTATGNLEVVSSNYSKIGVAEANVATFENTYVLTDTSIELLVKKLVFAATGNMPDPDLAYEFELTQTSGEPVLAESVKVSVKAGDAAKSFGTISFTKPGTYEFTISELEFENDNGFQYANDSVIVVEVTDNGNGTLTATVNDAASPYTVTAINTYTTEYDSLVLNVTKSYTGVTPREDDPAEFTFTLIPAEDNDATGYVMGETTATIQYTGEQEASFGSILFTKPGEYTFTIVEETELPEGWTADTNAHTVVVTVTDEGGKLKATAVYDEDADKTAADFVNNYSVTEATIDPWVKKTVEGDSAEGLEFNFTLVDLNDGVGYEMTDKTALTITGEGSDKFGTITFTLAGTYKFEITEEKGDIKGMTYDETVWTVIIEVEDKGGKLEATVKYEASNDETSDEAAEFVNNYDKPEEPTPTPTPVVTTPVVTTPAVETTPSVETTTPGIETNTPAVETTPSVETTTPGVETTTPGVETETPAVTETPAPVVRMTNLSGTKTWVDNNNEDGMRPETIEIVLYANGVAQPNVPVWTNTDTNVWTYTFTQLPAEDAFGREITYTVTETPVDLYVTTQDGVNFTNTIVEKEEVELLELSGEKTWVDNDNENNTRPESITVELLRNGVTIDTVVVTAADDWKYTFTDLPEGDGYGHSYTYTVREQTVAGYYAVYDGMNITNVTLPSREVTFPNGDNDTPVVSRRLPNFQAYNAGELSDMFLLFDYDVPLFGFLLGTGLVVPAYPFIFGGIGLLAIVLVLVFSRKKKEN